VESVKFHPHEDHRLFAACGNAVYEFDLRSEGVLLKTPVVLSDGIAAEDINAIAISPDGERLAVADDSGVVTLVETNKIKSYRPKRLRDAHTNIINTIGFHPSDRHSFASGGFDCQVCTWDLNNAGTGGGGTPVAVVNMGQLGKTEGLTTGKETINPPFVQCLSYCNAGQAIAVVLGDGSLKVVDASDPHTLWAAELEAHGGMATALYTSVGSSSSGNGGMATATAAQQHSSLIFSGGVDRYVKCWRLRSASATASVSNSKSGGDSGVDSADRQSAAGTGGTSGQEVGEGEGEDDDEGDDAATGDDHDTRAAAASAPTTSGSAAKKKKKKKKKKSGASSGTAGVEGGGTEGGAATYHCPWKLNLCWERKHHAKINVIAGYREEGLGSGLEAEGIDVGTLFIADTTSDLSIYSFA
jgi:hypothetical protein